MRKASALGIRRPALGVAFESLFDPPCKAYLQRGKNGESVYHDLAQSGTKHEYLTLPSLLASKIQHRPVKLRDSHHVEWHVRLLVGAKLLAAAPVDLPELPDLARHGDVPAVYEGLRLLLGCRWILEPGKPVAYSGTFVAAWCAVSRSAAANAVQTLRAFGILEKAGEIPSRYGNPTFLYLPGDGA